MEWLATHCVLLKHNVVHSALQSPTVSGRGQGACHAHMHTLTHARTQRLHTIYTKSSCLLSLSWCNSSYAGCHHEAGHPRRRTKTSINAYFHITRHTCLKCTAGSEWSLIWTSAMKSDISTHQWFTRLKVTIVQVSKDASPGLPQQQQQQQHDSLSS